MSGNRIDEQLFDSIQTFLLRTSILDRLCGPLCDAVLLDPAASGQATLEYLERANLFIVPLDNERRWYRYHHLFADLLRQRLQQSTASSTGDAEGGVAELHMRASQWYEDHGLEIEAFHHAAAANDVERAERLIEGKGMPLQFRGAGDPGTELAGVAADDGTGCQTLVVGDVCLGVNDDRPTRPPSNRNSKLLKRPCKAPNQTTRPETLSDVLPPCGPRWLSFSTM